VHVKGKSLRPENQDWPAILNALEQDGFAGRLELETHIFGEQQVLASHDSMKEIMMLLAARKAACKGLLTRHAFRTTTVPPSAR